MASSEVNVSGGSVGRKYRNVGEMGEKTEIVAKDSGTKKLNIFKGKINNNHNNNNKIITYIVQINIKISNARYVLFKTRAAVFYRV